ncbi:MAG: MBL fold metallo-hydrolase [Spirochaetia bacterium]|nr:MBL fold metallo-hydrolase [Spirochaetota bacterium]MCX8096026.1 MBL fold metallo-hydrolase [Spirochaetota bacterium]MDW8111821.1 MBL fold metallo-hydrolase [Spirochaetia bacterium]
MGINGVLKISYLGHSCFLLETDKGTRILTDPFDKSVGYNTEPVECNIITISHEHFDHSNARMGLGMPRVFKGVNNGSWVGIDTNYMGIRIFNVSVYHDESMGKDRGKNSIFVLEFHDTAVPLRVCHLGDLGHDLKPEDITRIGKVDVIFVPVGGYFTIDARVASNIVFKISPKVVIPMHYKTNITQTWNIDPVDKFLEYFENKIRVNDWNYFIQPSDLQYDKLVLVMDYRK